MKSLIDPVLVLLSVLMSVTGTEEVIYAQVGDDVTLHAPEVVQKYITWNFEKKKEAGEQVQLAWLNPMGGRKTIQDGNWTLSLTDKSLTLKKLEDKHFGKFICTVSSASRTDRRDTVYRLVKVTATKSDSLFLPDEPLSLSCDVDAAPDLRRPDIHWLNPQRVRVENNRGALSKRAERQDGGVWTCVIAEENKVSVTVKVMDFAPAPEHHFTSPDSALSVPCSIPSHISWEQIREKNIRQIQWHFSPKPSAGRTPDERLRLLYLSLEGPLTWKTDRDKDLKPASDTAKGNLSLYRHRARAEDRGDYTCSMTFKNGVTVNRTVHVQVLQITSSAGTEVRAGATVNLSCSTGEPLTSGMQLKWFSPEQPSVLQPDHRDAHLTIQEAGAGDGGKWRCELWRGDERLTSATLTLKIEPKLSVWMLVTICSAAVILILLLIVTFILCRRSQRKTRHVRHRLCQCRNPKPRGFYRT